MSSSKTQKTAKASTPARVRVKVRAVSLQIEGDPAVALQALRALLEPAREAGLNLKGAVLTSAHPRLCAPDVRTCIGCGCTDLEACDGGCGWDALDGELGVGVCSNCTRGHRQRWDEGDRTLSAQASAEVKLRQEMGGP